MMTIMMMKVTPMIRTVAGDGDVVSVLTMCVVAPAIVQTAVQRRFVACTLYVVQPDITGARPVQVAQRRTAIHHRTQTSKMHLK